jgi:DNA-binding transcriptional ArsR family regulator
MTLSTPDQLSQTFAALADPTRRAMLARLSQGEASVSDLAQPFLDEMSLPAVTKHLKVLEKAGLVTKTRSAQWRPCKLNGTPLKDAVDWMEQYRVFWEESFDRLGEYLETLKASAPKSNSTTKPKTGKKKSSKKTTTEKGKVKRNGKR